MRWRSAVRAGASRYAKNSDSRKRTPRPSTTRSISVQRTIDGLLTRCRYNPRFNLKGTMADTDQERLAALEAKVQELDALVNLAFRLLAAEKPVSDLLKRYGATEAEDLA